MARRGTFSMRYVLRMGNPLSIAEPILKAAPGDGSDGPRTPVVTLRTFGL